MAPPPVRSDMAASLTLASAALRLPRGPAWRDLAVLLYALRSRILGDGYRPELHYMRGGRTPGAKSLARA